MYCLIYLWNSINFFFVTLPFMPHTSSSAGRVATDATGAPAYKEILSHERFFVRAGLVKRQMSNFIHHPLFMELAYLRGPLYEPRKRKAASNWRRLQAGETLPEETQESTSVSTVLGGTFVMAHGGSTLGNVCHPYITVVALCS
jgi:hypothetical protein